MFRTHPSISSAAVAPEPLAGSAIAERYHCPEEFLAHLSSAPRCQSIQSIHELLAENRIASPFEPTQIVDILRHERYVTDEGPNRLLRELYYSVRPLLPVSLRRPLQRLYLRRWETIPFPQWPLDMTVEEILDAALLAIMRAAGLEAIPFIWFWPYGADSAAMVTHDVETIPGRDFCSTLMDINESFGIRSGFQLVPEDRYPIPLALREEIRGRGHDVNVQDLNHDGRLFSDRAEFEARAKRINQYGREFGAKGFRSAVLYRNLAWFDQLDFEYDMSVPNTARLDPQRGGCCTVFPYFVGDILELPLTTTQDYSLFNILCDYRLDLWQRQAAGVTARNGLLSFIVHPDYILNSKARATYRGLLEFLCRCRSDRGMWIASPNELNAWWRLRNRMELVKHDGGWHIRGAGSDRAQIAYATVSDGRIRYARVEK